MVIYLLCFVVLLFGVLGNASDMYSGFDMLTYVPVIAWFAYKVQSLSIFAQLAPMRHRTRVCCSILFYITMLAISAAVWLAIVALNGLICWQLPNFYVGVSGFLLFAVLLYSSGFMFMYVNLTSRRVKWSAIILFFAVWIGLYVAIYLCGNALNGADLMYGGVFEAAARTPLGWLFSALFAAFGVALYTAGIILCARRLKPKNF